MAHYSIDQLPLEERPRERLIRTGAESLTATELVAIILGSGNREKSVMELAQEVITRFGGVRQLAEATLTELIEIKGLGMVKAVQLKAALNLGLRASKSQTQAKYRIDHPSHAYLLIKDELQFEKRECFIVILQDVKEAVISHETVSVGTLSQTLVHPREVFYPAIRHKASSVIVAHNHPSGDPTPSLQDITLTQNLVEAGKVINIPLVDHLIVGENRYISLRQHGHIL